MTNHIIYIEDIFYDSNGRNDSNSHDLIIRDTKINDQDNLRIILIPAKFYNNSRQEWVDGFLHGRRDHQEHNQWIKYGNATYHINDFPMTNDGTRLFWTVDIPLTAMVEIY